MTLAERIVNAPSTAPVLLASPPTHRVRVYDGDRYPSLLIASYFAESLQAGGAAMCIATRDHGALINAALEAAGIDVESAARAKQFTFLDAEEILSRLIVDGAFDASSFQIAVEPLIVQHLESFRSVRIFGEVVDLLCRSGRAAIALQLESCWNRARDRHGFDLLCAYDMDGLRGDQSADAFSCVVHEHAEVELDRSDRSDQYGSADLWAEIDQLTLRKEIERRRHLELEQRNLKASEGFLAQAARIFSSGLDYEVTIKRVAYLMVPAFAEWCLVDLLTDDCEFFDRVAIGSHEPRRPEVTRAMKRRLPLRRDIQLGISKAIVDLRPQLLRDVDDDCCRAMARDQAHLEALRALRMKSAVVAPMIVRGRAIGALTLVSSTRNFDDRDLRLVEQLALSAAAAIENARMFQREQLARTRMTKVQAVTAALSRASSAQEVADAACRIGTEMMSAVSGALWLAQPDGSLELIGSWGTPKGLIDQFRMIPANAVDVPAIRIVATGEPIWVETAEDYERASPSIYATAKAAGHVASYAAVPLWFGARAGGMMCFSHVLGHHYDQEEREFYSALARQCAQALDRSRLFDASRRLSEETGVLFRLTEAANRAETPEQIFEPALEAVMRALGVDRAAILLYDDDGVMRFKSSRGLSPEYRASVEGHSPWTRDVVDPTPIFIDDVRADETLKSYQELFEKEGIGALGFVPLYQNELLGKFMVYSREPRCFSAREIQLAGAIATQVSQAIRRAHLFAEAEAAHARTSFLEEVSAIFSSSLEWEQNLRAMARLAVSSFADFFTVDLLENGDLRRIAAELGSGQIGSGQSGSNPGAEAADPAVWRRFAGEVLESKRSKLVNDGQGSASWIITPILDRGALLGLLTFARTSGAGTRRPYRSEDQSIAELIGRRAGIAIDNARLFDAEKQAREALSEADGRKNEFIAVLAHELRNPLAPILNAVEILRRRSAEPGLDRPREIIGRQATHMSRMIDDLLDISRITSGKMRLRLEPMDLTATVRTAIDDQRDALERAGLHLTLSLPEHALEVIGDQTRLAQVVGNLLQNAIKFTERGGAIAIELNRRDDRGVLSVRDTGVGMTANVLERIFQPFSQDDRTLARTRGGLGLGLALVRGLVELHGGSVMARSEGPGRGAELIVEVSLAHPARETRRASSAETHGPGLRILVVEDNVDAAEMLVELLGLAGHETAVAHDGRQALERSREFRPNVVLCDIGLPGELDGYGVATRLRTFPELEDACLVALTGYGQAEDRERAQQAGFDRHLVKPVAPDELLRVLSLCAVGP